MMGERFVTGKEIPKYENFVKVGRNFQYGTGVPQNHAMALANYKRSTLR